MLNYLMHGCRAAAAGARPYRLMFFWWEREPLLPKGAACMSPCKRRCGKTDCCMQLCQ